MATPQHPPPLSPCPPLSPATAAAMSSLLLLLLLIAFATPALGGVLFSELPEALVVSASPKPNQVLTAGEGNMTVTWRVREDSSPPAGRYKTAKARLCYAPVSQEDRAWRKTRDDLFEDKTCQFSIATVPFDASEQTVDYAVGRNIPTATYFVRVYALDDHGKEVAYGQTTDARKEENLFEVKGIIGRHASVDVAAACFSAASVAILVGFFVAETRKGKK